MFVAAGVVLVVATGFDDASVVVAFVVVLVAVIVGVLEATDEISAVDVDATRTRGVVVEMGADEVAST